MTMDSEYYDFINWLRSQSGGKTILAPSRENYKQSALYLIWTNAGRPANTPIPGALNTPQATGNAAKPPQIISVGGWDLMPEYDLNGNIVTYTPIGRTTDATAQAESMRQFNEQMGLSREQFNFQKQQAALVAQQDTAQLQSALAQQRAAQIYAGLAPKTNEMSAQERAQIYEQVRDDVLGGITSPRDWIKYLQVKGAPNPYQSKETDMESQYNNLTEELKRATSAADIVRGRLKDLNDPLTPAALANPQSTEEQLASLALKNESDLKGKLLEFQIVRGQGATNAGNLSPAWMPGVMSQSEAQNIAQQQDWAMPKPSGNGNMTIYGSPENPPQKTGTPIPEWMKAYVPGLKGKQYLEEAPTAQVTRPSPQSWMSLSDNQAQMLAGLADYRGQDWNEMLRQMAIERPKAAPVPQRSSAFRQR